jgi:RES domain
VGAALGISIDQCAPFLSTTLVRLKRSGTGVAALREALLEELKETSGAGVQRKIEKVDSPVRRQGDANFGLIHYSELRAPAWYLGGELKEERHHIVVLVQKSGLVALTFSDPALRKSVVSAIRKQRTSRFVDLEMLTTKQINDAFVGSRVRTLWLSGAHRRSVTKADSKILSGLELEAALNPLEDQSYYFSSVRSTLNGFDFDTKSDVIVGANPRNARVWLGPSKNWRAFVARTEALIDAAIRATKKPSKNSSPLPVLAQPIEGIAQAQNAYDMAIIDPETSLPARGISVFYGALAPNVALAEIRPPVGSRVMVGKFDVVRPLKILDVEALRSVLVKGSIFESDHIRRLERAKFLGRLSERITRPVMPNDEPSDYLITQAIADYLASQVGLDGILYPSAQVTGAKKNKNIVLFHSSSRVEPLELPPDTELSARTLGVSHLQFELRFFLAGVGP